MDLNAYRCTLAGCSGPLSGVCINDLAFDECPDLALIGGEEQQNDAPTESPTQDAPRRGQSPDFVSTLGAGSLDALACDILLRERGGILVGVVAGPEVGKTTMIATIYEMVHRGKIPTIKFAGSETLRGYEERCHLARVSSSRMAPDTPRTPIWAKLSFTHLKVLTPDGMKDLVFSDRSGEHFDNVLDRPGEIGGFSELIRADILLVLVDIEQMLRAPHVPTSRARRLMMTIDKYLSLEGKSVRLVGTKADLARSDDDMARARKVLDELAQDLRRRTGNRVSISPLLIATRPKPGSQQMVEGLDELMEGIFSSNAGSPYVAELVWPSPMTELDALMLNYRSNKL